MAKKSPRVPASPRESENEDGKPGLVPKLRFPEFRGTEAWKANKLARWVQLVSGIHLSPERYSEEGLVPYFTGPSDFTNNSQDITKRTSDSTNLAKENDTLITVKGSGVGEIWYLTLPSVAIGRQLMALRAIDASSRFIFQLLLTKRQRFEDLAAGNLIPGLSRGDILDLESPFPSLPEQRKIADCLSSLDELIGAQGRKVDALRTYKKGLMQQLFPREGETQPRLRFPEFQHAGEWEEHELGLKVDLLSGYPFDGPDISQDSTGIPLLRGINVTEGRIRHNTEIDRYFTGSTKGLEKYRLRTNDLVIGMDGSKVGKNSALISNADADALLIQRVARLRASNRSLIQFIFYRIHSPTFHSYVDRINTSSGIPHISAKQIKEFRIAFPSEAEQQRIATCLSSLDDLITAGTQKLEALKTHKRGLMQQLFPSPEEN